MKRLAYWARAQSAQIQRKHLVQNSSPLFGRDRDSGIEVACLASGMGSAVGAAGSEDLDFLA